MRRRIKRTFIKLLSLNNTPPEIALGIAIGVFIAILPVYGFHTLLVLIAAVFIRRANKIAILIGTNISLPPTVPFITWAGYEMGKIFLKGSYPPLDRAYFRDISFQKIANHYPPLFLGSVILGIGCAILFYFLTYFSVKTFRARRGHAKGQ